MRRLEAFAPGRVEIAGNHTDHQGGIVVAATIEQGIHAQVQVTDDDTIRIESEGFEPFELSLECLRAMKAPDPAWHGTTKAIVAGMIHELERHGVQAQGFDLKATSDLPAGGGLSSSAAFELLIGRVVCAIGGAASLDASELARMAQRVECQWFGKPCGLMDQMAIACGGTNIFDFYDAQSPQFRRLCSPFKEKGYALVLTDTGIRHDTPQAEAEYAAVPQDMFAVARALGAERLRDVMPEDFQAAKKRLEDEVGELPVARAQHYYDEIEATLARALALQLGNMSDFFDAMSRSNRSIRTNLRSLGDAEPVLQRVDEVRGAGGMSRIHGGGFGGSILTILPTYDAKHFMDEVELPGFRIQLTDQGAWARDL